MESDSDFRTFMEQTLVRPVKFADPDGLLFLLALDRMVSLTLTDQRFEYDKDFDPAGWFRNCYGTVRDSDVPVEKVVIRAFGKAANLYE